MSFADKFKFGSAAHTRLLTAIKARYDLARGERDKKVAAIQAADDLYKAYTKETDDDGKRRVKRDDGSPKYTTVVVPYSYAMVMTIHTYMSSVFLSRNPIFQFTARKGKEQSNSLALEALTDYQVSQGGMKVPLFVWLLDMIKYGDGVMGCYWAEEFTYSTKKRKKQKTLLGLPLADRFEEETYTEKTPLYKGNKLYNIRPLDWLPDPRVPILKFQDGEFCARVFRTGWNALAKRPGYFNLDEVKRIGKDTDGGSMSTTDESERADLPDIGLALADPTLKSVEYKAGLEMYVEIIPKDWGLGSSEYPEKWVFTVINDTIIIGAEPYNYAHGKFPFIHSQFEIDGHSMSSRGLLEISSPLNDVMTWLLNSHFYNVRKSLNNVWVSDPSKVLTSDIERGGPGGHIRLRPAGYGTDVRSALHQMPVADVTRSNIKDMQVIADLIQRVLGASDNAMGVVNQGGRKTATEVRTAAGFSLNRQKTAAEFTSAVGFEPLARMLIQNSQQFYSEEEMFRRAGELSKGPEWIGVSNEAIAGFFDYVPVDGTLPIDRMAQANLWKEILVMSHKIPIVGEEYDILAIVSWVANLTGIRNLDSFKRNKGEEGQVPNLQVMPDQQINQEVQAGNLLPPGAQ